MTIFCKEINDYLEYVEAYPEDINKERHLLIENVVKPTLARKDVFFDEETFNNCINFCEKWYYPLFPYQKFIYAFVFMYVDDMPLFRTFIIEMGRGNGKDGFIVPLVTFLTTHFYGVDGYNIDIVATSQDQAEGTYRVTYDMFEDNKQMMKKLFYWNKQEVTNNHTRSRMTFNTSNAKTKDGKKTGAVVFNEYHAYETDEQIKVFQSGLGKVKHGRIFIITTNGDVRGGPMDELLDVCVGVLNGESNDMKYFPFLCKLDDEKEVDDFSKWVKANPSIPFMPVLMENMKIDYAEMKKFPSKRQEFMTKRMNIPMRNEDITVTSWENLLRASYDDVETKVERYTPDLVGKDAVVGIDFASFQDFTSAGFLFKDGNEYIWRSKTWICKRGKFYNEIKFPFANYGQPGFTDFEVVNEDYIDERLVVGWVAEEMQKYNVKKIVLDSHRFLLLKQTFEEYGISAETRTDKSGLVRMIRFNNSIYNIVAPKIEKEFIEGNLNFGDSAMMRWSTNNTAMKKSKAGDMTFEKIEPKLRKNDTFMAFVHAMSAADEFLTEEIVYAYI